MSQDCLTYPVTGGEPTSWHPLLDEQTVSELRTVGLSHARSGRLGSLVRAGDREDLVHDAIVQLNDRLQSGKVRGGGSHLRAALRQIIRHRAIDRLRIAKRRKLQSLTDAHDPGDEAGPREKAESREAQAALGRAINHLPEDLRAVVLEHDFHGRTFKEMARATGVCESTLKSRHDRAMDLLAEAIPNE